MSVFKVDKLMAEARRLAAEYHRATGKPLVNSSEIAEFDAARLLHLQLVPEKSVGYDALGTGKREGKRILIKGRAIFDENKSGQRIGQIKAENPWDSIVLVIMDDNLEPLEIYEAQREAVIPVLAEQSANRAKRGAMSVTKFKYLSRLVWTRDSGEID